MSEWGSVIKEVERDTGRPFVETVKFYAEQGHTAHDTAYLIGYKAHSAFLRLLKRKGWREWFANGKPVKVVKDRYPGLITGGDINAIKVEFEGIVAPLGQHADRLGLPRTTVYPRYRKNKNLNYVFSKHSHRKSGPTSNKYKKH